MGTDTDLAFECLLKGMELLFNDTQTINDWLIDSKKQEQNICIDVDDLQSFYSSSKWQKIQHRYSHSISWEFAANAFTIFSREAYATHPWHHHSQKITEILDELDYWIIDFFHTLYVGLPCTDVIVWREKATKLYKIAKRISGLIQPMQGTYYSKPWAVKVAIEHEQNTSTHYKKAIDIMITNNRIPRTATSVLSELIKSEKINKRKKNGRVIVDSEWKAVGNNRRLGFKLALVPRIMVQSNDSRTRGNWYPAKPTFSMYRPPKIVCLPDYFGTRRDVRFYFSPRQFPTPIKIEYGDCCDSFHALREYIYVESMKQKKVKGGGVSTTGGHPGKSVRFSCMKKGCKFYFWLKWDNYGYYIHHHNGKGRSDLFIGCLVHNH